MYLIFSPSTQHAGFYFPRPGIKPWEWESAPSVEAWSQPLDCQEVPAMFIFDVDLNQALAWENTILVHDRFKVSMYNFIDWRLRVGAWGGGKQPVIWLLAGYSQLIL